ncbi:MULTISPECIES: hypothetical protein [Sphingomonas]|uniref:hypothetical protein n=1 Tax=Sphingomonas TaxID=13687 RepID=UPI001269CE3A|nr:MULTISPECIES: hypothetical protein [Sphingomonas]
MLKVFRWLHFRFLPVVLDLTTGGVDDCRKDIEAQFFASLRRFKYRAIGVSARNLALTEDAELDRRDRGRRAVRVPT